MRKPKGLAINGWLVLDKPLGMTSTDAVGRLKRLYQAQKVGHAGTLDPLATGVLPIAFGEATKTVPYVVDGEKSYLFTVAWGAETDTDDSEGRVTRTSDERPPREAVEALLPRFTGEIQQLPPQYSAIKIGGARAYDLARDGETFELQPRPVVVHRLAVAGMEDASRTQLVCDCGKGTYVRALARDLGRALGCFGHVVALRRTRVGPFQETSAVTLDRLEELARGETPHEALMTAMRPVETALDDMPSLNVGPPDAARLKRGQAVLMRGAGAPILSGPAYAMSRGMLVAVGEIKQGELHPVRVFNLQA